MSLATDVIRVAANTSTGNQTFTGDLGGLTPKLAIFIISRATADGTAASHSLLSVGATDGSVEFCHGIQSRDAQASSSVTQTRVPNTVVQFLDNTNSSLEASATFVSFGTDAVTINWGSAPASAYLMTVILMGGTDLSVDVSELSLTNAVDTAHDVTDPGFEPDLVLTVMHRGFSLGAVHNNRSGTITQKSVLHRPRSARPTTEIYGKVYSAYGSVAGAGAFGSDSNSLLEFSSFDSSGFTITTRQSAPGSGAYVGLIALRFGTGPVVNSKVWTYGIPTSTGSATDSTPNFKPQFLAYITAPSVAAIDTYYDDGSVGGIGIAAMDAGAQFHTTVADEDLAADSNTQSLSDNQAINTPLHTGAAGQAATFTSFGTTGVTLNWSDVEASTIYYVGWAIEELSTGQSISGAGNIASAEAFGSPTVTTGAVTVSPSGIASAEAFGTATITLVLSPTGIATAEAFGTPTLTVGSVTISPTGIATAEAFGTAVLTTGAVTISPTGIATEEAFGTATLTTGAVTVSPTGIASAEAFGTSVLSVGTVTISPTGIATAEAFGTPTVTAPAGTQTLSPTGIPSEESFGTPVLTTGAVSISPTGIPSAESFGTATITLVLSPTGIASAEAFGNATITTGAVTISPSGIPSAEAFGTTVITTGAVTISPTGIPTEEAFGTAVVTHGAVTLSPTGIASAEAFGTTVITTGAVTISPTGIPSAEAFGTPSLIGATITLFPTGIPSAEAFGTPTITTGAVTLSPTGIASAEAFGTALLTLVLSPVGIESAETFGTATITPGAVTISPTGIASEESFGSPAILASAGPSMDVSLGNWVDETWSTTNIYQSIDDFPANDGDYIQTPLSVTPSVYNSTLDGLSDPGVHDFHIVKYRYRKQVLTPKTVNLVVKLKQGVTLIASWSHNNIGTDWVDAEQTLTTGEAASITDYNSLSVELEAVEV